MLHFRKTVRTVTTGIVLTAIACAAQATKTEPAIKTDPQIAAAIAEGVRQSSPALRLVGLADSELIHAGVAAGLATAAEAFADRAYRRDGTLVPRTDARAVHTDGPTALAQALSIAIRHRVQLADGHRLDIDADTLCLHGDTPGAAELARMVRAALDEAGVDVVRLS